MKQASMPDEDCFVGHRSLYHFFHIFLEKITPKKICIDVIRFTFLSYDI